MWERGSVEGSIFVNEGNTIFMYSDSYLSLKTCVQNKIKEGHRSLIINLYDYDGVFFRPAFETIHRVSTELGVDLSVSGFSKERVDYNAFPMIHFVPC